MEKGKSERRAGTTTRICGGLGAYCILAVYEKSDIYGGVQT